MSVRELIFSASSVGDEVLLQSQLLQSDRTDINTPSIYGRTPVWIAWVRGHDRRLSLLIAAGAIINTPDSNGWYPIATACERGHTACVSLLQKAGADISTSGGDGCTPINYAYRGGHSSRG